MIDRILKLPKNRHFFLFGARNTGKSTLLQQRFDSDRSLWIDLLDPQQEDQFARRPNELVAMVKALPLKTTHVVLDEIQKVPRLLNVIHGLIENTNKFFIMSGSSARKLKYGSANLLAGRAFVFHLYPFSFYELKESFNLNDALHWGMLPSIYHFPNQDEKLNFLQAYALTYLKEEIWGEHLIRKLDPFRNFLEVAAQCNGKILNFSNISRDVGIDDKTIKMYYHILEDTLIGFFLQPFQHSFRKRLNAHPKFYLFDVGVTRALSRTLTIPLKPGTSAYGETFEHFIILECMKMATYYCPEYRFSYLKTKDDAEIDLVVERPGKPILFIEIKSNTQVDEQSLHGFGQLIKDFGQCEGVCFSNDPQVKRYDSITVWPWQQGILHYFNQ